RGVTAGHPVRPEASQNASRPARGDRAPHSRLAPRRTLNCTVRCRTIEREWARTRRARSPGMPSPTRSRKRERVEARVSAEQKALIERAARLRGCSLSEYLVRSAQDAAE